MMHNRQSLFFMTAVAMSLLTACGDAGDSNGTATLAANTKEELKVTAASSPGKPSAPISFRYEVQGTPIVGQPVAVNVFVTSSINDAPINVFYRVNDASSMLFPESQALATKFVPEADDQPRSMQITVIPQREGRLYLNVSAEIETADGTMLKTTSIPIQVGSAPPELEVNGELVETEEGETVISMPAEQSE
jgi:hypothetical protein